MARAGKPRLRRAAIAVVALSLAACGGSDTARRQAAELTHIHGLGASGNGLYVATHNGLFEVADEQIRPVGTAAHDLMGFTVAGPNDLLASGHPDLRVDSLQIEGKPPLLGLVHSTDGVTWEPLSLLGEADFHSLVAAHDRVYGFDGTTGRFLVSEDRQDWETRAAGLGIWDFAVSPDDADVVVASTEDGVGRSTDGGRTWEAVSSTPLTLLGWTGDGLYATTTASDVAVSHDEGATWKVVGRLPGPAEALYVDDGELYVAVSDEGILRSSDGGTTFDVVAETSGGESHE